LSKSYINAYQSGRDTITHIYIENDKVKSEKVYFKPFFGVKATKNEETNWTDMYSRPVKLRILDSMSQANEWRKENKGILDVYGDVPYPIQFIASTYKKQIDENRKPIKIMNFDIEVYSTGEFPKPDQAKFPINAITVQDMNEDTYNTFSLKKLTTVRSNVKYHHCKDEEELLVKFIDFLSGNVHIMTGWNIMNFDIPYIVNRCKQLLDPEYVARISPERKMSERTKRTNKGIEFVTYEWLGVIVWDYIDLYQKYQLEPRESYSLDAVCKIELGESKVNFKDEHDDLNRLYDDDFEKFIEYNIRDVELVSLLDKKMGFIDLGLSIMYMAKCTPDQIFGTVGAWDSFLYNQLLKRKMLAPPKKDIHSREDFIGGYVKEPTPGFHKWVVVYDIASSYPSQIICRNLSPETILDEHIIPAELKDMRNRFKGIDTCCDIDSLIEFKPLLQKYNVSYTSNGNFFDISKVGVIPGIVSELFEGRKLIKKQMKTEKAKGYDVKSLDMRQMAIKILMNSLYGAMGNVHFRYFDRRIAEAITSDGQVCVKGVGEFVTNALNIPVIYSDTDSIFCELNEYVKNRYKDKLPSKDKILEFCLKLSEQFIQPKVKEFFLKMSENMNMRTNAINMETECVADSCFFTAKKRYVMNKVWDEGTYHLENPKLKIRGIEIVRTSTPQWCRDRLKKAVNLIFETESNEDLIKYIKQCKSEFKELPFEQQAFPRGVNFSNYQLGGKAVPIQVRAALLYNHFLKKMELDKIHPPISNGSKMKYCYIIEPNHFRSDIIGCHETRMPDELKSMFVIDVDKQFGKAFIAPLEKMFTAIGWHTEEQNNLDDFFC
jgi:DNA polymerase elongation subunit (family B)